MSKLMSDDDAAKLLEDWNFSDELLPEEFWPDAPCANCGQGGVYENTTCIKCGTPGVTPFGEPIDE